MVSLKFTERVVNGEYNWHGTKLWSFDIEYFYFYIIYSYFTNSHYSYMVRIKA